MMADSVCSLSDLATVPFRLSINNGLLSVSMHKIMTRDGKSSDVLRWDDKCRDSDDCKSLHQMSYALKLLFPYPVLCTSYVERLYLSLGNIKTDGMSFLSLLREVQPGCLAFQTHVTGSKGENLTIPLTFTFDEDLDLNFINKADTDLLAVVPEDLFQVKSRAIQTEGVHPGYFRYSGSETAFALGLAQAVSAFPQLMGQMHGPSVMANTPLKAVDHVAAFKFFGWPEAAQEFCSRKRPFGWPSKQLLKEVVEGECHMVLKPHNFTEKEIQNEWRFSFSIAEKKIAASLTKTQRMAFILLKLLQREYFHFPNEITSYHLKTTLFWECENVPSKDWTHHKVAERLLSMIDWFHTCLKEHNLPSYFIPSNNLIDHIPPGRIQHIESIVAKIRDNLFEHLLKFLKKNRMMGCPFSVEYQEFQDTVKQLLDAEDNKSDAKLQKLQTNMAIKCASWQVADFYLTEKVIRDTTQFSFMPGEGTQAAYLIKYYLQNQMVPLRAASFILQEAWSENDSQKKQDMPSMGKASEIFNCLANIDDHMNVDCESMTDDQQVDKLINQFLEFDLPATKTAVHQLKKILDREGDTEYLEPALDNKSKLQTAWNALTHLVAYCFMILSNNDQRTKGKYLQKLQDLKHRLAQLPAFKDIYSCSQQLEAFSLLTMGRYAEVEAILDRSTLKPRAAVFLKKMLVSKQKSLTADHSNRQWAWGSISIKSFDAEPKEKGSSIFKEWIELKPTSCPDHPLQNEPISFSLDHTRKDDHPVGRVFKFQDRTFQDSCLMRWEEDVAHNLLVPSDNLLRPALQSMMDRLLSPDQATNAELFSTHPSCKLAAAKSLFLTRDTGKAIILLEQVVDAKCTDVLHRLFPLESRLMLDDRVLAGKPVLLYRDHCDFSLTLYALFLLVKCYHQQGETQLAQMKVDEMTSHCEMLLDNKHRDSYPWEVHANNLTLLGTAQNICGIKAAALSAFANVTLLKESKRSLTQTERAVQVKLEGKPISETVRSCLKMLKKGLKLPTSSEALRCFLDVLYPEANLKTALNRLMLYCAEDTYIQKEC